MLKSIFYFKKPDLWDIISIAAYLALTAICACFFLYANNPAGNKNLLSFYSLGTQLLLYLINYKSLRNLTVYFVWIFIASAHLLAYFQLKDSSALRYPIGHAATGLRNTIILLFLYQILRITSWKTQKQELIAPIRGGGSDFFGERNITFVDFTLFAFYFATTIFLRN